MAESQALPARAARAFTLHLAWRGALLALLVALAYQRAAPMLWRSWMTNENYSHGPLVPLVSGVLVWRMRQRLRALPVGHDARGLAGVVLAAALLILGQRSDVFALQGYSIVLMAAALVWTFLGLAWLRALAFPLIYLLFMLPFPPAFVNHLSYALKEVTVRISTVAAQALGVTLQQEGMNLYLGNGILRIENPCSGLRSLISLLATGALFAYFQPGAWWRKLVILVAAVPLAMMGNAVRITALILVAHYGSVTQAAGRFHDLSGLVVFAAALVGMFLLRGALEPRPGAARVA